MSPQFWEVVEHIPSVVGFLDLVTRDLREGRSVIVLLPPGIPPDLIWDRVCHRLYGWDFMSRVIDVGEIATVADRPDPREIAKAVLDGERVANTPLYKMVMNPGFPDVVRPQGLAQSEPMVRSRVLGMVGRWAEEFRTGGACLPPDTVRSLCLVEDASVLLPWLPAQGPRLVVRWWWGFPSALELRLVCRLLAGENNTRTTWLECLVAGMAAGDLALAEAFWSRCPMDFVGVVQLLQEVASDRGLTSQRVQMAPVKLVEGSEVPPSLRKDWAAGRLVRSYEHGVEAHPAQLIAQADTDELEHRAWRGQAQTLLPLADVVRLSACRYVVRRFGREWHIASGCCPRDEEQQARLMSNPLDAELGYLLLALKNLPGGLERFDWIDRVELARQVRNDLAHYQPVPFSRFRSFLSMAGYVAGTRVRA